MSYNHLHKRNSVQNGLDEREDNENCDTPDCNNKNGYKPIGKNGKQNLKNIMEIAQEESPFQPIMDNRVNETKCEKSKRPVKKQPDRGRETGKKTYKKLNRILNNVKHQSTPPKSAIAFSYSAQAS